MLDKHLCFRYGEPTETGAVRTRVFRWTKLDETIYELASAKDGAGWSTDAFLELLPELRSRLKMYEAGSAAPGGMNDESCSVDMIRHRDV
jgi:hypothetical protein